MSLPSYQNVGPMTDLFEHCHRQWVVQRLPKFLKTYVADGVEHHVC